MKHWFRCGVLTLATVGAPVQGAVMWNGVVLVADGRAEGSWTPAEARLPESGQWQRWEQMEKLAGPEALRRSAPPGAVMMPDTNGRSVLAVAPHAGIKGYVVDAGSGMVDLRGAEVVNTVVRLGSGGSVMAKNSFFSTFHVAESTGGKPGGSVVLERCAVTGPFGGVFWSGAQRWVVVDCHFKSSQLPWVSSKTTHAPVIERCHFEKCFIPASFLLLCRDCTFDGCMIGSPDSFGGAPGKPFTFTQAGGASGFPAFFEQVTPVTVVQGEAKSKFWSQWKMDGRVSALACRMAARQLVQPLRLSGAMTNADAAALTNSIRGKIFRRLDGGERLQFDGDAVKVMEHGAFLTDARFTPGEAFEAAWTQSVEEFPTENGFGQFVKSGTGLKRQGFFSADGRSLVVIEEIPGSAPDPVRVFRVQADVYALRPELNQRVTGTVWQLDGPEQYQIRFDTPGHLTWFRGGDKLRGGSLWRADQQQDDVGVIADWQGTAASFQLESGLKSMSLTVGTKTLTGTFVRREPAGILATLPQEAVDAANVAAADKTEPGAAEPGTPAAAPEAGEKTPETPKPATTAPTPAGGDLLKSRTCRMNGLLVAVLAGGKTAGATSQMNISAVPVAGGGSSSLGFNQKIGPLMEKALIEVQKFQTIRQGHWPDGFQLEISFADKYTPKDGPSAAVACALLLEGLYTGEAWDPGLAVTGDLNADGSVQPVGGVPAKIRGAVGRKCRMVGVPVGNIRSVRDYFLSEGPHSLMGINVFVMKEFDHARDLAMVNKSPALTTALAEFDKVIRAAPPKDKAGAWLKQPAVAAQLRKVVAAAPHHLSAMLLLEYAEGRAPTMLSLTGSIEAIELEAYEVIQSIRSTQAAGNISGIREDGLGDALYRLRRMRSRMHPETRPLLDSMENFSKVIRTFLANPPRTAAFINKAVEGIREAGNTVDRQYQALRNNPEVMAEIMKE